MSKVIAVCSPRAPLDLWQAFTPDFELLAVGDLWTLRIMCLPAGWHWVVGYPPTPWPGDGPSNISHRLAGLSNHQFTIMHGASPDNHKTAF